MIHRSFIVPFPPGKKVTEAQFTAPVTKFLGVVGAQDGIVLTTLVDQKPEDLRPSGLVLPGGTPMPASLKSEEPLWVVLVCYEGDPEPETVREPVSHFTTDIKAPQYLGSILTVFGPAAIYVRRG